jgi:predicted DNA-binding transcriptional regulator YafY
LREAIRKRRVVAMAYADGAGKPSLRRVRPLAVWSMPEGWMFTGWCELRRDFRTFRLDRIAEFAVTDVQFADEPEKGLAAFLEKDRCEGG